MIKYIFSFYFSLFLAAGPVAAQIQEAAAGGRGGPAGVNAAAADRGLDTALPGLPGATPGLTGALPGGASSVIASIEAAVAKPEILRALAVDSSPAAVYARALIASSATPAVRDEAVKSLGEDVVSLLETSVRTLSSRTAGSAKASAALKAVASQFAALDNREPETLAVAAAQKPGALQRAGRALKAAAITATLAITMAVAAPASHAQNAFVLPDLKPVAMTALAEPDHARSAVVRADDINDAIAKWTPDTHLIIMGDPGLDEGALRSLAAFLADKHWTVIVAENASGMSFRDVDGNARHGEEALEYGAGQGLFRKNGFSSQVDKASGLADGSILVISMREHYLFLRNSEAQRVSGLDAASQFTGNLDQWAIARLRAGGDISGAVMETVSNVDSMLRSAFDSSRTAVSSAGDEVDSLEKASAAFLEDHPTATGDLARPDLRAMREKLKSAGSALPADPAGAKSSADSVASEARRLMSALTAHAAGAGQIAAADELLRQLEARERAGAASAELVAAGQALREAREAHGLGASAWISRLQDAKSSLADAERAISDADAAAKRNALLALIFQALLGLGTLGASVYLNWRARRARVSAESELLKWDGILETKLDAVIDEFDKRMDVYVGPISGGQSRGWEGETADAAARVRQDAGKAKLYLAMARSIHDRATSLVRPAVLTPGWFVNQFSPSRYLKAERMLATEPLTFKPEDGFEALFDKKRDWRGDLYGEAKDYEPVSENFESVMAKFNATSKSAVAVLDEIEKASTGYGAAFDAIDAAISAAEKKAAEAARGAFFKLETLGSKVLPRARETLAAARGTAAKNPVGAMKGEGALAERMAADAGLLAKLALSMRADELGSTDPVAAALAAASIGAGWIADARAALDEQASRLAGSLATKPGAEGLEKLKVDYAAHAANVSKAKNGLAAISASRADAVKSAAAVDAARSRIASVLRREAADMLREAESDPTRLLASAVEALDEASRRLGAGRLAEAEASHKTGADLIAQANGIVAASLKSIENQDGNVSERVSEAARLDALLPERSEILKTIKRDFAASTLGLTAGDATHPNANGTISDNIDEAQAAIDAAKAKREKAVRAFREAKLLEAASLLGQAEAHEKIAQSRLDEISEKRARLDKTVADNASALERLEAKSRAWKAEIPGDRRSTRAAMQAYDAAVADLAAARAAADARKGDPFKAAAAIAAVSAALDQVWIQASNDRDAYAEAARSLEAAETQLETAARLAKDAQDDGVTDSAAISAAYRNLERLSSAYKKALASSQVDHGEWREIDREADRITSEAASAAASLKGELAAAARAVEAISRASATVREATNWTGSYGVSIPGSPGSGSVNSARSALNNGDYDGALRQAESARNAAVAAIQAAEAEVTRRRRAEEEERRRQEAERRRRQQEEDDRRRRSDSGSSWGGSGGGGSGWGGSSSGGGSSRW